MQRSAVTADARLSATAREQLGLVTRQQAYQAGLDASAIRRRIRAGRLIEVLPGVLLIAGTQPSYGQQVLAHVLWAGRGKALASHRCAGALLGLEGMRDAPIEIVSITQRRKVSEVIVHKVASIPPQDHWALGVVPVPIPVAWPSTLPVFSPGRKPRRRLRSCFLETSGGWHGCAGSIRCQAGTESAARLTWVDS